MKNFQPGGLRNRKNDLGGRPRSDTDKYAPKKRYETNQVGGSARFDKSNRTSNFVNKDKTDVKLYPAICTTCGQSCEVPFRPDGSKPVLCRDCFATKNSSPTNMNAGRDRFTANELHGHEPKRTFVNTPKPQSISTVAKADFDLLTKQLLVVETKVNQILDLIKASEKLVATLPIVTSESKEENTDNIIKKVRKPKKESPAIKKASAKKKVAVAKKISKKVAKKTTK